jgi:hypothetical protein
VDSMSTTIRTCSHMKPEGIRCGSPALRHRPYCYSHNRLYSRTKCKPLTPSEIPVLRSKQAIGVAIKSLLRKLDLGGLSPSEAQVFISAIRIAQQSMK